jgi:hypothetical protein
MRVIGQVSVIPTVLGVEPAELLTLPRKRIRRRR